uniref:Tissue factor pathway inhibitor n=1 Tax=Rhipicephalus appendiculatus TaxID=34631 RepID=A0A131YTM6_RHIAP
MRPFNLALKLWLWGISSIVVYGRPQVHRYCLLKPEGGPCRAAHPRWFFNFTELECQGFTYGGCSGNENNFLSQKECQEKCPGNVTLQKPVVKYVCSLGAVVGKCRAAFPRWYFNMTAGRCEKFFYGGCGGNWNNFEKRHKCEEFCQEFLTDPCSQPILPASSKKCPDEKKQRMFGYNRETGKCESFESSSCRENRNRFSTRKKCLKTCASDSTCLYKTHYNFLRFYTSYYYDADKDKCYKTTTYYRKTKLYPNDNRFSKKKDCEKECMPEHTPHNKLQNHNFA